MGSIKEVVRSSHWGELMISRIHELECAVLPKLIPDDVAVRRYYKKITGKSLNLELPETFCEKLNWYKLKGKNLLMEKCANKYTLREYVRENGYERCLNDLLGVYTDVDSIDLSQLPDKFVIKASHGTHMQIIVKDKKQLDWNYSKKLMKSWMRQDIYWRGREWVYKDMPRHLIIEKYLEDESGELRDYKIFCFNGVPRFIQNDIGRFQKHIRNYHYTDWTVMDMTDYVGNDPTLDIPAPKSLDEMLAISKVLSKPFQFVRVDFYEVNGQPYIGEMTFFHEGGSIVFIPDEWNKKVGEFWKLKE